MIFIFDVCAAIWSFLLEAGALLVLGILAAGAIGAFSSLSRLGGWLRGEGLWPVFKATLVGMPLPICSCGIVPVAASLMRRGAGKGPTVAFIVSTPETGVDSLAVTYAFFDPLMTALRPVAALVTAVTAGVLAGREASPAPAALSLGDAQPACCGAGCSCQGRIAFEAGDAGDQGWHQAMRGEAGDGASGQPGEGAALGRDPGPDHDLDEEAHDHGHAHGHGHSHAHDHDHDDAAPADQSPVRRVLRESFDLLEDIGPSMAFGLVLAGLIEALMPPGFVEHYLGKGIVPMLIMLAIGLPSFVCASMSTPIVAALVAKGLSAGGAIVYLLTGPATNVATVIMLNKLVGTRATVISVVSIALVALGFGLAADAIYDAFGMTFAAHLGAAEGETHGAFATVSAVVAGLALLYSCLRRYRLAPRLI